MSSVHRIRVLVAEHDRWTRLNLSDTLNDLGFAVHEASNGMAALRIAAADPPHIVLVGDDLPEVSTADVLRALESDSRNRHTAVLHVRDIADPVNLLASILKALKTRHGTRAPAEKRVRADDTSAPKRARGRPSLFACRPNARTGLDVKVRAFRSAGVLPSIDG